MTPGMLGGEQVILAEATIVHDHLSGDSLQAINRKPKQYEDKHTPEPQQPTYEWQIVWRNVLAFVYLHLGCLYGIYLMATVADWRTIVFSVLLANASAVGVTAGAHRLWAHRTYKAKWPMRLIMAVLQTVAFQNHIYEWSRDHRVHHKFSETDADPHNAKRGFFFSHIGWLMVKKLPEVKEKGKTVDMSDLETDPIVMFQKKYYLILMPLLCFVVPSLIPWYLWGENGWVAWYVAGIARYTLSVNGTWLVNSAAHIWGNKPYDRNIGPTNNNNVALIALGEGWHNYHHVFPWDYKAAELGSYYANITTAFIDFFYKIGWAYDLKVVSEEIIRRRILRTGDGSHPISKEHSHDGQFWGWGDKDMTEGDGEYADTVK